MTFSLSVSSWSVQNPSSLLIALVFLRSLLAQCHTLSLSIRHCHNLDCIQDSSRMQLSCSIQDFYQPLSSSALHRITTSCACCVQGMPHSHRSPDGLLSLKSPHAFQQASAAVSRINMTDDVSCHMQECVCVPYADLPQLQIICSTCTVALTQDPVCHMQSAINEDHQLCMQSCLV